MATVAEISQICINNNIPFFTYQLPQTDDYYFGAQLSPVIHETVELKDIQGGFILHPFRESPDYPSLFIKADIAFCNQLEDNLLIERLRNTVLPQQSLLTDRNSTTSKETYQIGLKKILHSLRHSNIEKIVFSRVIQVHENGLYYGSKLLDSLQVYKSAFRFWVHIPHWGSWMGATPETLLCKEAYSLNTMALAGTRAQNDSTPWKAKEYHEQQLVADYIKQSFEDCQLMPVECNGPLTHEAGPVKHLCTYFHWPHSSNSEQWTTLLRRLHPTPAVCGIPLHAAYRSIEANEPHHRKYYSGFLGPVDQDGNFNFFVNLRSMELFNDHITLFIGGGITRDSIEEDEWNETEHKAQTMLSIINQTIHGK